MSLLKEIIEEMAAGGVTTAGAIAGFRSPIGAKSSKKKKNKETKVRHRLTPVGNFYTLRPVKEDLDFDPSDVESKLARNERKAQHSDFTKSFALEDENGNIVKVTVPKEEAEEFERALSLALRGDEDLDDVDDHTPREIAEVLFKLKDRFTIVDCEWPEVEEDQEEDATEANAETMDDELGGEEGAEGEDLEGEDGEGMDDEMVADDGEDDAEMDQMSMLSKVIDLLKSQQDTQRAEYEAQEAEAEAKKAEAEREAAMAKVRQEEQILDMETYYKNKKEGDKEAKRLAQLAKWKHDMAADGKHDDDVDVDIDIGAEEEEHSNGMDIFGKKVDANNNGKMEVPDFIRYLFKYMGNNK